MPYTVPLDLRVVEELSDVPCLMEGMINTVYLKRWVALLDMHTFWIGEGEHPVLTNYYQVSLIPEILLS